MIQGRSSSSCPTPTALALAAAALALGVLACEDRPRLAEDDSAELVGQSDTGAVPPPAETSDGLEPAAHPPEGTGHHPHGGMQHDFSDVEQWVEVFENPERDAWQHPADVVRLVGVSAGMTVADIGAGTGYFLSHLSTAVGPDGRVLALDIEPNLVAYMAERAQRQGWDNVTARRVAPDDPRLEPSSVDRVLIVDTWHHIADRPAYSRLLARALKSGGTVTIVDFTRDSPQGPSVEHRLPPTQVMSELESGGLRAALVEEDLPYQYVVVGVREEEPQPSGTP